MNAEEVSLDYVYYDYINAIQAAGTSLAGVRDGLGSRDGTLIVSNVIDTTGLYNVYDQLSTLLDSYGLLIGTDTSAFRQLGVNQENEDSAQGGN